MPPALRSSTRKAPPGEKNSTCPRKSAKTDNSHPLENSKDERTTAVVRTAAAGPKETTPADIMCPIAMRIMENPVVAEDGRFYERGAIEEHITKSRQRGTPLRSPMTNEAMGPNLLPAHPFKGLIEELIVKRNISGPEVDEWKQRRKEVSEFDVLKKKAARGDGKACRQIAVGYMTGRPVPRNMAESMMWFEKGAKALDPVCIVEVHAAKRAIGAEGVATMASFVECDPEEISLLSYAAALGNDVACLVLGLCYYQGKSLGKNHALAASFLCKGLVGPHRYTMRRSICSDYIGFHESCVRALQNLKGTLTINLET